MGRGGNHPKHPKCPGCKKALYKSFEKGKPSKKEDLFKYCRDESCELYGELDLEIVEKINGEQVENEKTTPEDEKAEVKKKKIIEPIVLSLLDCQYDDKWSI
jgi:hypothetical protein